MINVALAVIVVGSVLIALAVDVAAATAWLLRVANKLEKSD
jgi:hypothetical protein